MRAIIEINPLQYSFFQSLYYISYFLNEIKQAHSKFRCETHPQNSYRAICYAEKCLNKRRLLCLECVLETKDKENIVSFQKFFQDPIGVLDLNSQYFKFTQDNISGKMLTIIDSIETQINQLHQKFIDQLRKVKDEFIKISNQNREQLIQRIKIKEFQQQLTKVWHMDSYQGTEEFKVLEKQLNDIIVNWKNISQEYIKETTNNQQKDQIIEDLIIKLVDYRQQFSFQQNLIFDNQQIPFQQLDVLWKDQGEIKPFIYNKISKGKEIRYKLLYQGTRDGLNNANYWQKCNQQSHLLTIITLKNGNIIGGYSPCYLILKDIGYWAFDDTNQSFVFQYQNIENFTQNNYEIYKLKSKQNTILCSKDYGPIFGNDILVINDFKTLNSTLGSHYDLKCQNVQNKQTHLIGDQNSEIVECKVYKITFR